LRNPPSALSVLAVLLVVGAVAASAFALAGVRSRDAEVDRLTREVAAVRRQVARLQKGSSQLAGRVKSTERTLRRSETGIAPLATRVLRSVFTVQTDSGYGSGFAAWRDDGATFLVTAAHVVEDSARPVVTVSRKGGSWSGEIVGTDDNHDLAVIRIAGRPARATPLWQNPRGRRRPQAGQELLLVGSPFGLEGTVTTGVVSRVTKRYIQTDAAANPGNSGGPALDKSGHVVGVLVSGGGENINFAIPIQHACKKLRDC
jgi:serine protease Do